jgi:tRNA-Thr(GGU) m(6)t(6)A37 methyltransferase TsaA
VPVQPNQGSRRVAHIEIDPDYREGLADLSGFDRIWVLSFLHKSQDCKMKVIPFRDTVLRGLFSTRAPCRPNPIGLSLLHLLSVDVETGILKVRGIDLLDGTPILDIKPYVPRFECYPKSHAGWLDYGMDTELGDDGFAKKK